MSYPRQLLVLFCLVVVVAFAGCGSGDSSAPIKELNEEQKQQLQQLNQQRADEWGNKPK